MVSFSAVILVSLCIGEALADSIKSLDSVKHVVQGGSATLSCSYSGSVRTLQWYRQDPHAEPQFLQYITTSQLKHPEHVENLSVKVFTNITRLELEISSVKITDSAVYYCALQPTVTGNYTTLNKNLKAFKDILVTL